MKLQNPASAWIRANEQERNRALEQADGQNHKRNQDIEVGGGRLMVTSDDGTRYEIDVSNGGSVEVNDTNGTLLSNAPQQVIYVREASQLSGTLSSTKLYFIDGELDMGTTQITVPEGGLSLQGHGFGISGLNSTENTYTMFINEVGTHSGDIFLTSLDISVSGTGSKVFDVDNLENGDAIEWNTVNFISCTSLGEATKYRQGLARNIAWISCDDGLTMSGAWSGGFAAVDSIVVGAPMAGVLFKAGAGLVIGGSFRSNINALQLYGAGGSFCDFSPSNITLDEGFLLDGVRVDAASGELPNMPPTSTKALIRNCVGMGNTYPGGALSPSASSAVTISASNTLYQVTGAMTLSDGYWFSKANTNGLKLDSTNNIEVLALGTMSFSGSNGRVMAVQLRKYDAALTAYSNIGPEYSATLNGGGGGTRAENISFSATTNLSQDDRIEVWVKNLTDTTNITLLSGGIFQVYER